MIDANKAGKLNKSNPDSQSAALGTEMKYLSDSGLYYLECSITADATGEKAITIPFACEVVDVIVQCRASNGGGTATLKKGSTAITNAIAMATDKAIARAGTIDDAQSTLAAGDAVTVDANGANDRGLVTVVVRRL
jgi:hypothetical protein